MLMLNEDKCLFNNESIIDLDMNEADDWTNLGTSNI